MGWQFAITAVVVSVSSTCAIGSLLPRSWRRRVRALLSGSADDTLAAGRQGSCGACEGCSGSAKAPSRNPQPQVIRIVMPPGAARGNPAR
jgi:hypothetical protein